MKRIVACLVCLVVGADLARADGPYGPWVDGTIKGRIALSHDGNFNDEDDWGAFPVIVALLDGFGVKDKLVHIDYNNIIQNNDARFQREMTASVLGACERYGVDPGVLHDCCRDLDGAVASLRDAVNASSAENPLYYLVAGPMDVPCLGLAAADPAKRRYVYCLSHSVWNDGFGNRRIEGRTKRDVIALGARWMQVQAGAGLTYSSRTESTPEQWAAFEWMHRSADERLRWIYSRLQVEGRCDVSDATIAYSFLSGDEHCDVEKLRQILDKRERPRPLMVRPKVRLEAENFRWLDGLTVAYGDRQVSHRVYAGLRPGTAASRRSATPTTDFVEIYTPGSARYQVTTRYRLEKCPTASFTLRINGRPCDRWTAGAPQGSWQSRTSGDVLVAAGDEIALDIEPADKGQVQLDYVEFEYRGLDVPDAMPGQVIADPANRRYLRYNGQGRAFLFGAGNPEEFFYLGNRQADGTRSGGGQDRMIDKMAGSGANTFHVLVMRDSRYNLEEGNGSPDANPFVDSRIDGKLDADILAQWEGWLTRLESAGVVVFFNFYNDFDDYEGKAGWKLDAQGELHPQEKYLVETLVNTFKHHKNIIWAIEESTNKLSRPRQARLKKVAQLVAQTDGFHHPIAAMFQIMSYDEVHADKVGPADYADDSYVQIITWGHYNNGRKGLPPVAAYYEDLLAHGEEAAGRYVLVNTEVDKHPYGGAENRLYSWTSAMAGRYTAMSSHRPDKSYVKREAFADDGRIRHFMEGTDFGRMLPHSELKLGSTLYVLAAPGHSYIAYAPDATKPMGLKELEAGTYLLRFFDTTNGRTVEQVVGVPAGDAAWQAPATLGKEIALYVQRLEGVVAPSHSPQ